MTNSTLAARLKWARKRARLTQVELAARAGLTQGQYCRLETGANLKTAKLAQLAHVLNVDPYWLATGDAPSRYTAYHNDLFSPSALHS